MENRTPSSTASSPWQFCMEEMVKKKKRLKRTLQINGARIFYKATLSNYAQELNLGHKLETKVNGLIQK